MLYNTLSKTPSRHSKQDGKIIPRLTIVPYLLLVPLAEIERHLVTPPPEPVGHFAIGTPSLVHEFEPDIGDKPVERLDGSVSGIADTGKWQHNEEKRGRFRL